MTVLLTVFVTGCSPEAETATPKSKSPAGIAKNVAASHVHDVSCGCAIDAVGACGEYISVDGKFVELEGDLGLGEMPFCGQKDLKAEVTGELKDGKFVFADFKLLEPAKSEKKDGDE